MHGGVPTGGGQYHLIVSLFDARSHQRVSEAQVVASVTEPGFGAQRKSLEAMSFAGTVTFVTISAWPPPGRIASNGKYVAVE